MTESKKIGVRDVARAAGVSVATVSRVLSGAGYPVAEATRDKVKHAAEQLGFIPNLLARTFSTSRTDTIGIAMPVLNAYYAKMLAGIERQATASGLSILLSLVGDDHGRREQVIDQFLARQLDGIIICSGAKDSRLDRGIERLRVPAVIVGQQPDVGLATVTVDNHRASREATAHLLSRGHRRILFLTSDSSWPDFRDRLLGFKDSLAQAGAEAGGQVVDGVFDEGGAYDTVRRLMGDGLDATAILAATDRQALGALAALSDLGLRVPQDMAVVGFDNYHTSEFVRPALTSVDMPADAMGAKAVDMLVGALAEHTLNISPAVLPPALIIRQSS